MADPWDQIMRGFMRGIEHGEWPTLERVEAVIAKSRKEVGMHNQRPADVEARESKPMYAIELRITLRKIAGKKEADDALEKIVAKIEKELLDGEYLSVAEIYTY